MEKQIENAAVKTDKTEDKLDVLFRMQAGLDSYIREKRGLDYSRGEWVCKKALALMVELGEVVEEAKYATEIDDA